MPRKGYHSVTLPNETYEALRMKAKLARRSIPDQINFMLDKMYPSPPWEHWLNDRKFFKIDGKHIRRSRLIMEWYLKRRLTKEEIVHHINENKADDRPANLKVMPKSGDGSHNKRHALKEGRTPPQGRRDLEHNPNWKGDKALPKSKRQRGRRGS